MQILHQMFNVSVRTGPSPKIGVPYAPKKAKIREWPHFATGNPIHFMFGSGFSGSADRMALFPVTSNPSWRKAAILDNFEWPYRGSFAPLSAHRTVIFAIAQLSC